MTSSKEWQKMVNGELYWAWDEDLQANRDRCRAACQRFNNAGQVSRRRRVELWRDIVGDTRPLPPIHPDHKEDEKLFDDSDPVVEPPISVDHGINFKVGKGTFLNFNLLVLDTCLVTIGERVLFGPNVCIYGATHPLDPAVRRGLEGPEAGKEVHIEDDVWIGGSAIILLGCPAVPLCRGKPCSGDSSDRDQYGPSAARVKWIERCMSSFASKVP